MDHLLMLAHGLVTLSTWITNHKELIGLVVAGSGVVSLVLEPVKRWLSLQSKTAISVYHYLFAVILLGFHYVQGSHSSNPLIVFAQAFIILGTNQFVYPLLTRPLFNLLSDAKASANVKRLENTVEGDFAG